MTREEIKAEYTMRDILARYGIQPNRAGFIRCPFHAGDREASLKVYEKDFHCFGCGANGDIFSFVMRMEDLTFPQAFMELGGTFPEQKKSNAGFSGRLAVYKAQKRREMERKQKKRLEEKKQLNNALITIYRKYLERMEPLSDAWCITYNALQSELYKHGYLNEKR